MIYLRTIRLDFLDVGPTIENLEIFEHLENLYLQFNKLTSIGRGLSHNPNLVFLALHNNQLRTIEGLGHLKRLAFLDLSNNLIERLPEKLQDALPCQSLMVLKLQGNPMKEE
jgi:Leucine-rich repeat (LRR) protein